MRLYEELVARQAKGQAKEQATKEELEMIAQKYGYEPRHVIRHFKVICCHIATQFTDFDKMCREAITITNIQVRQKAEVRDYLDRWNRATTEDERCALAFEEAKKREQRSNISDILSADWEYNSTEFNQKRRDVENEIENRMQDELEQSRYETMLAQYGCWLTDEELDELRDQYISEQGELSDEEQAMLDEYEISQLQDVDIYETDIQIK